MLLVALDRDRVNTLTPLAPPDDEGLALLLCWRRSEAERDWPEYSRGSASSNSAGASQGALSDGRMSEMFV